MTALQLFKYKSQNVRTVIIDDQPWFVAKDVCRVLDIVNTSDAVSRLDEDGVGNTEVIDSMGRKQRVSTVNQYAVLELAFASRKDKGKEFRRWVRLVVLPEIAATGSFNAPVTINWNDPMFQRHILESGLANLNRAEHAERKLALAAPKIEAYDALMDSDTDYSVRSAAQLLFNAEGVDTGEERLFRWLRENRWLDQKNQPLQPKLTVGYMRLKLYTRRIPATGKIPPPQARITPKGLERLLREFTKREIASTPALTAGRTEQHPAATIESGRKRRSLPQATF